MVRASRQTVVRRSGEETRQGYSQRVRRAKKQAPALASRKAGKASYNQPPVLVRNTATPAPAMVRKSGKNRRRFDVALNVPGAEVRLPSLPSVHVGWNLLSGLLALVIGGLLYYAWTAPMFQVDSLEINGLKRLTAGDVNTVLGISSQPIFLINPSQIQTDLQTAFPEFSSIDVEVGLPARVTVTVNERIPVISWKKGDTDLWIDSSGVSFPPRGDAGALIKIQGDLPVLPDGNKDGAQPANPRLPVGFITSVETINAQAPKNTVLIYDPEHGLGWKDKRGWQVYFGTSGIDQETMAIKLKIYADLAKKLDKRTEKPAFVSVEYVDAPYFHIGR